MQFRSDTYLANHVLVYEMQGCMCDFREWIQFYIRQICLFEVTPNQKKNSRFRFHFIARTQSHSIWSAVYF